MTEHELSQSFVEEMGKATTLVQKSVKDKILDKFG
jgi:hypothetical protein